MNLYIYPESFAILSTSPHLIISVSVYGLYSSHQPFAIPTFHFDHQTRDQETLLKAFTKSTKDKYSSLSLVMYFSCCCHTRNITSTLILPGMKLNSISSRPTSQPLTMVLLHQLLGMKHSWAI